MLEYLDVESIELLTNNPEKVSGLRAFGVEIEARIPHVVAPNDFSRGYLEAKRLRMAHELPSFVLPLAGAGGTL